MGLPLGSDWNAQGHGDRDASEGGERLTDGKVAAAGWIRRTKSELVTESGRWIMCLL